MRLAVVREGRALVLIGDTREAMVGGRLEPAWLPVFYNPVMEFNRDLSVAALRVYARVYAPHRPVVVEPLSATGVRAVRYALESDVEKVIANDIDENAYRLIRMNAELNGVEDRVAVYRRDARSLLYHLKYEDPTPVLVVDLDPYGSPAPFLDAALDVVGHGGLVAMTATDLAVLEGSKPRPALRRYHARLVRTPQAREVAVRVLLGYAARVAAAHDKAVRPLLAYYSDHYVRVYLLVERGARRADRVVEENLGFLTHCVDLGYSTFEEACPTPSRRATLGPLWTGPLYDAGFVRELKSEVTALGYPTAKRALRLLETIEGEVGLQDRPYQAVESVSAALHVNMPKIEALIARLREEGFRAARTHFSPTGVRTDAGYVALATIIASMKGSGRSPG